MKILFLDFDGVLNSERYIRNHMGDGTVIVDPLCMTLIRDIVRATKAKIVLTTSWREYWSENKSECSDIGNEINDIFSQYGLTIYSKTPHHGYNSRESEIEEWLTDNPEVTNFVAIDDKTLDSDILEGHFVKTAGFTGGISEDNAMEAIDILNGNK